MQIHERDRTEEPTLMPDDAPDAPSRTGGGVFADTVMALRFFSRLPTGDRPHEAPDLRRMAPALPFASLIIGFGPALLLVALALIGMPSLVAAALAVAASLVVTGAMAGDALADSIDGLFGGHDRDMRLTIMKDSRHGTYGVSALCLYLILVVTTLGAMAATNPLAAGGIWLAAGIVARSAALWLACRLPSARSIGAGATAGSLGLPHFLYGLAFAGILMLIFAGPFTHVAALVIAAAVTVMIVGFWTWLCRRLVGGQTGDLTGGLMALVEVCVLITLATFV